MRLYLLGSTLKALDIGSVAGWWDEERSTLTPMAAYRSIPWVRRCVDLRAGAVARMPYAVLRDGVEVQPPDWLRNLGPLLGLMETALCIYGAAYLLVERRGSTVLSLRHLAPQSVSPQLDPDRGLTGFQRTVGAREIRLGLEDVVFFFEPSPDLEAGPGAPLIQAALDAAKVAAGAAEYLTGFFERGAIPAVLLSVEGNPPEQEMRRLEEWWKRMLRGVRRAWETVAVRATVKPQTVGISPGKELAMNDLLAQVRQQIAVAFGVPQTLIEDAANYATAAEHRLSFYEETIIPRCEFYERELNRQLLNRFGLAVKFQPERLEIFQQREAQKAQGLVALVQAGIMTPDEARIQMGLEEPGAQTERMEHEAIAAELRRWRAKSQRKPDEAFVSDIIPPHLASLVEEALKNAGPGIWDFLKQQPPARDEAERRMERTVAEVFAALSPEALRAIAIAQGGDAQVVEAVLADLDGRLRAALTPELTRLAYEEVLRLALEVGTQFDPAVVNSAALEWAQQYAYDLVRGITETTRNLLRQAISQYIATPGMTEGQLEALIAPAFGKVRAQMIAVTETTRAYSQAAALYQRLLAEMGFQATRVWRTRHDERVCPVCGPLEGVGEGDWPAGLRSGPPAHVNCRCWVTLEYRRGRR